MRAGSCGGIPDIGLYAQASMTIEIGSRGFLSTKLPLNILQVRSMRLVINTSECEYVTSLCQLAALGCG